MDSIFSPVRLVNYFVEDTRVGQDTDFDRLILEVKNRWTYKATRSIGICSQVVNSTFDGF